MASPIRGVVVEASAARLVLEADGVALPGTLAAGEPTHGELVMAVAGPDGELPPSAIDVGSHGAILVAGARIDLEALGRARAMGVRGVVVGGLVSRDLRGFRASEVRQRAALHGGPPFAVLVLDGYGKRPIAPSIWARLLAAAGREVAIGVDPPHLLLPADLQLPAGAQGPGPDLRRRLGRPRGIVHPGRGPRALAGGARVGWRPGARRSDRRRRATAKPGEPPATSSCRWRTWRRSREPRRGSQR